MDTKRFWEIIMLSKEKSDSLTNQIDILTQLLSELEEREIIQFDEIYQTYLDKSYTTDLWDAAFLLQCGCSDDGFLYFRSWLIYQGHDVYHNVLKKPEYLCKLEIEDKIYPKNDLTLYAMHRAYENKTGTELPNSSRNIKNKVSPSQSINQKKMKFPCLAKEFHQNCE